MNKIRTAELDKLMEIITELGSVEECYDFFEDLCTIKELKEMSNRMEVAFLLDQGGSYVEIADKTGVSQATISRVKKCLEYGTGGYRLIIEREKERK